MTLATPGTWWTRLTARVDEGAGGFGHQPPQPRSRPGNPNPRDQPIAAPSRLAARPNHPEASLKATLTAPCELWLSDGTGHAHDAIAFTTRPEYWHPHLH